MTTLTITVTNFRGAVLSRMFENEGIEYRVKKTATNKKKSLQDLLHVICELLDETDANIKSHSRKKEYVYPRHLFCYLCESLLGNQYTLKQMGYFINRHHSSIIHGREAIKHDLFFKNKYAKKVQSDINEITKLINL